MISITVDSSEIGSTIQRVTAFITELKQREDLNQMLKEQQNERWVTNFESEGGEYSKWPDIADATVEDRAKKGYGPDPTLFRSGRTFLHFVVQNQQADVSNTAVDWNFTNRIAGRNGAYTVSHHTGYTLGKSRVPARVLWDLDQEDEDRGASEIEQWVDALADKYFG